ncbi:hypothetical protein Btru_060821 [Bulinus truncatus]|nr:hypothetical protein Btru_060821 [Bulinus truncatus]
MADYPKPRYIPAFLLRRGNKGNKPGKKQGAQLPRATELKQSDVVSKSVDSLLSVASSISLPPDATLRKIPRSDRHSLQTSSSGANGRPSNGQVRRHSYDVNPKDDFEFYDCEDGTSDVDFTSSSQEPSPIIRPKEIRGDARNSQGMSFAASDPLRVKRQSTVSSMDASVSLTSDWDSAESDIDEKNSNVLDVESLKKSDDDVSSMSGSPVITVRTSRGQNNQPRFTRQNLPRLTRQIYPDSPDKSTQTHQTNLPRLTRQINPDSPDKSTQTHQTNLPRFTRQIYPDSPDKSTQTLQTNLPRLSRQNIPKLTRQNLPRLTGHIYPDSPDKSTNTFNTTPHLALY